MMTKTLSLFLLAACSVSHLSHGFVPALRLQHSQSQVKTAKATSRRFMVATEPPELYSKDEAAKSPTTTATATPADLVTSSTSSFALEEDTLAFAETMDMKEFVLEVQQEQQQQQVILLSSSGSNSWTSFLTQPTQMQGRLLVIIAAAIYGTNFAAVKLLNNEMPLADSAALRFTLAAVAVTAAVWNSEQKKEVVVVPEHESSQIADRFPAMLLGTEVGAWYCIGYICQAYGLVTSDASKSAFFNALAVIVVPLLDSTLKGKKLNERNIASILLAIGGVALLQLGPSLMPAAVQTATHPSVLQSHHYSPLETLLSTMSIGDAFCLLQALFFGIGYWRLETASQKYPQQSSRITVGLLLAVAAGSIGYCLYDAGVPAVSQLQQWLSDPFIVKALAWTGLGSTALALYLETVALQAITASELTILMTSISLWGALFAYVTMGEVMSPIAMAGGALILAGCGLNAVSSSSSSGASFSSSSAKPEEEMDIDAVVASVPSAKEQVP